MAPPVNEPGHCTSRFQGDRCDACSERFQGDECDQCVERFQGDDCQYCSSRFQGDGCLECANGHYGDNCDKYFQQFVFIIIFIHCLLTGFLKSQRLNDRRILPSIYMSNSTT